MRFARRALVVCAAGWVGAAPCATLAEEAPAELERCDALVRREPDDLPSWTCYRIAAQRHDAYAEATRRLEAHLAADPANAGARVTLGALELDRGRPRAEAMLLEAAEGFAATRDPVGESFARRLLMNLYHNQERSEDARRQVARCQEVAGSSDDPLERAKVKSALGDQAYHERDFGRAALEYRGALSLLGPDDDASMLGNFLSKLGLVCNRLGRHEEAMEAYRRAAELHAQAGNRFYEGFSRVYVAEAAYHLLDVPPEERLALARRALDSARASGSPLAEAWAHHVLARELSPAQARAHYGEMLRLARESGHVNLTVMGLLGLAKALLESDPPEAQAAIERASEAVDLARRFEADYPTALGALARLRWATGPREQAIRESLATLDVIERLRERQPDEEVRARVLSRRLGDYYHLAYRLLEPLGSIPPPDDLELSYATTERMRARQLLERLDATRAQRVPRLPPELARRRASLLQAIAGVQRLLLDPSRDEKQRKQALADLERLELEETSLREEVARLDPAYAEILRPRVPSLDEVHAALEPDAALLTFQVLPGAPWRIGSWEPGSWALVHTRAGTRVYAVPDELELGKKVAFFLGLLEPRLEPDGVAAASLYRDLLAAPLEDLPAGVTRLTIVPDGPLHFLPFAALRETPWAEPVGSRYDLSFSPSASAWFRWSTASGATSGDTDALVLADPSAPGADASAERGGVLALLPVLGPLPHARSEARSVVKFLGAGTRVLAGAEATERFLKTADLQRYGILHFAAHALVDEELPERSGVLLAPGAPEEDGLLQFREIRGLGLADKVIVLSACRSVSGELLRGEGVLGLAHAFFEAGARTVVGSLWPLQDEEAAVLFGGFYRHLARGLPVSAALAHAQRDAIRSGAPAAAWAGVVVLGDRDARPVPSARAGARLLRGQRLAALAAILLAVVLLLGRMRRFGLSRSGRGRSP